MVDTEEEVRLFSQPNVLSSNSAKTLRYLSLQGSEDEYTYTYTYEDEDEEDVDALEERPTSPGTLVQVVISTKSLNLNH